MWYFLQSSIRVQHEDLLTAAAVHSQMIRNHQETRAGCAALIGLQVRARVDRQLATVGLGRGAATAFAHRGCIRGPRRRSLVVRLRVARTAATAPGSAQFDSYFIKDLYHLFI